MAIIGRRGRKGGSEKSPHIVSISTSKVKTWAQFYDAIVALTTSLQRQDRERIWRKHPSRFEQKTFSAICPSGILELHKEFNS
ncbi:hypothetical protein N7491_000296 [Penicillium cf. griseofulvum]|uniref:Uncharacterized protein n=1 Tax=Penicillium cf. griseofulvum TaxID=2972120 RepID=A0A9W9JLI8_9EURO|nr:hypothetical protein N7472_004347 [Penicillium cf. griseofulvum]KAJ5451114.1 hypothetical protein N7491_000296 [Penicillium cf. griseofulvum]